MLGTGGQRQIGQRGVIDLIGSAVACSAAWILLWLVLQRVLKRRGGGVGRLLNGIEAEDLGIIHSVELTSYMLIK